MKVKELLTTKTWIKGAHASTNRDSVMLPCIDPCSDEAKCWCLSGAILHCYRDPEERYAARVAIVAAIAEFYPSRSMDIVEFNDMPETKWRDVQRVIMHAGV